MNITETTQYQELLHFCGENMTSVIARNWASDLARLASVEQERDNLHEQIDKGFIHTCNHCGVELAVSIAKDGSGKSIGTSTLLKENADLRAQLAAAQSSAKGEYRRGMERTAEIAKRSWICSSITTGQVTYLRDIACAIESELKLGPVPVSNCAECAGMNIGIDRVGTLCSQHLAERRAEANQPAQGEGGGNGV